MKVLFFISLLILSYVQSNISICDISNKEKKNCGYFGIKQEKCEEKGCCYKVTSDGSPWCFHKKINTKINFIEKVLDAKINNKENKEKLEISNNQDNSNKGEDISNEEDFIEIEDYETPL